MKIKRYCVKHYRRRIEYIPVLVPVKTWAGMGCVKQLQKDLIYQYKCPVCWEVEKKKNSI